MNQFVYIHAGTNEIYADNNGVWHQIKELGKKQLTDKTFMFLQKVKKNRKSR